MLKVTKVFVEFDEETNESSLRLDLSFPGEALLEYIKETGRDDAAYEIGDKLFLEIIKAIDRMQ